MKDKNIQSQGVTGVFGVLEREQLFRKAMSMHSVQIVAVLERVATLEERIQRVIDMLKKAQRWTVRAETRTTLSWDRDPDGSVVDADGVDAALRVLEDEE